jgi:RimJ/RimL family protein N-acetyltransferase
MQLPAPTARLTFRAWRDDDRPLADQLWGDPQVSALVGGPFDAAQVQARFDAELANQRDHGLAYWPIWLGGDVVGCCGLKPYRLAERIYELGFYLRPPWWGGGIAVEAGRAVIAHAFGPLDISELHAGHHPDNVRSGNALTRLGFVYAYHELYAPTGLQHPCYRLARTVIRAAR